VILHTCASPSSQAPVEIEQQQQSGDALRSCGESSPWECFWQKAVKDGLKDVSIAKLAAKVSDFYGDAGDLRFSKQSSACRN
jgi:hypothetical protein